MGSMLRGRHFITTQEFAKDEIDLMLELSSDLKRKFAVGELTPWLLYKTVFMIFFDESTRTRNSIEAGITQLGGHAHFLNPKVMQTAHGEVARDTAMILSRYGHAIAVRHCAYKIGNAYLRELAKHSSVPILNLQDDYYHPMQVLADIMTIREKFGQNTRGLKVGISWAYAESHLKPLSVPQSQILLFPRYGLDVTLAYPKGFDLMPDIVEQAKKNAEENGTKFEISHDMNAAFEDADIVIPKSWGGFFVSDNPEEIMAETRKHKDWICTPERMKLAKKHAIYMHALPADRGREVVDEVIDGPQSVVIDEAENRLHTAKAVMALTMGGRP
ncbi:MAG: ornithine carbamoyltransferase [Kosmotoga sp.]|uniref:ornithine carbamoyltransferase n=1 Tax=Kosmotoga sp. TaxID=1955248 RepID=UPI001DDF6973|nr:ornithine carbamoyltransferase [Kosmotoga sp.]MBO8166325.1 ornithine carbamoyltransferase [Kosmotoga sp.]MCD6159953.1 ornithine carbamoyltransferase [Kosmotoga sp.]